MKEIYDKFEEYSEEEYNTAKNKKYIILVIYDITDDKQRLKVYKFLSKYGQSVQKSSFEARLSKDKCDKLIAGLRTILFEEDNVRIYKLYGKEEITVFGSKNYEEEEDLIII